MLQFHTAPCANPCSTSSMTSGVGLSATDTVESLNTQQSRVFACFATNNGLRTETPVETSRSSRIIVTLPIENSLSVGVVDAVRSDDPLRHPVNRGWLVDACRASLQECETVVTLATRQIRAGDEFSHEYVWLKRLAARSVMLIQFSIDHVTHSTDLSREAWAVTANACAALSAEADNFPFDGWVTRSAEGCRQLAAALRRAAVAGVESPPAVV